MLRKLIICAGATGLALGLGLTMAPQGANACHIGTKHNGGDPCGGGGDPGPVATNPILVSWEGPDIAEADVRSCVLEFANSDGTAGHYTCVLDPSRVVSFALTGAVELDKRGREDPHGLCAEFTSTMMAPDTDYDLHWEGICTGGSGCNIRVQNWYFDADDVPETGLINVEGFGIVSGTSNPNPFADAHSIDLDRVLITIKAAGTNKTLGFCEYDADEFGNLDVTFGSSPPPP